MAVGRAGPIQTLPSPFSNPALFDGMMYTPQLIQDEGAIEFQRPCTRGQSGSAAVVSYVELDRGMLPTSVSDSDSGGVSGAEGLSAAPSKEKKKVGRPISFRGDINSKDLTEAERRRIKRRVANRESARRVRQKRQETMEEMQARMDAMQRQTAALTARLQEVEQHKAMLVGQLTSMRDKWSVAVSENLRLANEAARAPSGNSPHETSSGRSTGTEVDFRVPSASCVPVSPPTNAQPACYWPPAPAYGAYGPASAAAATAGAVTSGQPNKLRIPSVTSSTQISGFRPGVTITSAVPYPKTSGGHHQQQLQPHNLSPPPQFAASAAPLAVPVTAPPAVSLAPTAGNVYLQGPNAPSPVLCTEGTKQDVPHMSLPQQQHAAAPASLKDAPSLDWEWFLHQSSLKPLLDEPNPLKGI